MTFLYKSDPARGAVWARFFAEHAPEVPFRIWPDVGDPAQVRYLAAWKLPPDLMKTFPHLEVLFCVGAGIDQLDLSQVPESIPVVRMIEPGLTDGMVEFASLAVLAIHRDWPAMRCNRASAAGTRFVRTALPRRGAMGMVCWGRRCREARLGFPCAGWNRTRRDIEGVECFAGRSRRPLPRTDRYPVCRAAHRYARILDWRSRRCRGIGAGERPGAQRAGRPVAPDEGRISTAT